MMSWEVKFEPEAEDNFRSLDKSIQARIVEKLEWVANNFNILHKEFLKGEFSQFYKLRVGNWRIFYKVDWVKYQIVIAAIRSRDKAYK